MTISIANQLDGGLSPCEPELSSTPGGSLKGTQELSASSVEMTEVCRNWRILWCSWPVGHAQPTRIERLLAKERPVGSPKLKTGGS